MAKKYKVDIVTAQGRFWQGESDMVIMVTVEGEMAIMAGHTPVVTALVPSALKVREDNGKFMVISIGGGFAEMTGEKATFLLRSAEWPQYIDVPRAEAAKKRAEERLADKTSGLTDEKRAQAAMQRAVSRLRLAQKSE